ncbi:SET domain-containing protein-lysine N-methyltransferase [bacterium]|nr:SET domain-containing protein-lysine N-methyltransferase [bacterium]
MIYWRDLFYFFKRSSFSWHSPDTQVRRSTIQGRGRFAKREFSPGETLAVIGGYIVDLTSEPLVSGLQISDRFAIRGSFLHRNNNSINHSCMPNCRIAGDIFIVADKMLKSGDEITLDYGTFLSAQENVVFIKKCGCGSVSCRGRITGYDWKILPEQKLNRFLLELRNGN